MKNCNRHGLSRDIPESVKRQVRQACGFGCVVCGASIIEYEHVDPEFVDATEHNAANITLLCPQCHSKVTRGIWSKEKIKSAMSEPRCKQTGFSNEFFDLGKNHPALVFGGVTLRNCKIPIMVGEFSLFEINAGEEPNAPFRLSGHFFNSSGNPSLIIRDNEWKALASNWDFEVSGNTIVVRDAPRHISLKLVADPPNGLIVEQMDMLLSGYRFIADPKSLEMEFSNTRMTMNSCLFDNCHVGLRL